MISTETSCSDGGVTITSQSSNGTVLAKDKQLPGTAKKTLRDVNENSGLARNPSQNFTSLVGGLDRDAATKVCGNKRPTPEVSGFSFYPSLGQTCGNEHIINARRRFELELGGGRKLSNVDTLVKFSTSRQSQNSLREHSQKTTQPTTNSIVSSQTNLSCGPSAPTFLRKSGSELEATHPDSVKPNLKCHGPSAFKGYDDQQRRERLVRLQNVWKECVETNCRNDFQTLHSLSPTGLSRFAAELQKRAVQLTIEEGKELQRMKGMNILGSSLQTNNLWQTTQRLHEHDRK